MECAHGGNEADGVAAVDFVSAPRPLAKFGYGAKDLHQMLLNLSGLESPSGAKAHADITWFMYGLKPVPFIGLSFSAACKARNPSPCKDNGQGIKPGSAGPILQCILIHDGVVCVDF